MITMKILCIVTALISASLASPRDEQLWNDFKRTHGKQYNSALEEQTRYAVFKSNVEKINQHNKNFDAGLTTYKMGVNQFADLTDEEFVATLTGHPAPERPAGQLYNGTNVKAAASIDWRELGAVTYIKNEIWYCSSSWSFSAVGALEGQWRRHSSRLISLSTQALLDCSNNDYGNSGCSGGTVQNAFDYVADRGLPTESEYPYTADDGPCRSFTSAISNFTGYVDIEANNEDDLLNAVSDVGPISVAIDASYMRLYGGGVLDDTQCSPDNLNRGVLVVGYGSTDDGQDYWIVKNSWGYIWGESGYIRMKRGINQCGIAVQASYPVF